jgi:hypothetical protein
MDIDDAWKSCRSFTPSRIRREYVKHDLKHPSCGLNGDRRRETTWSYGRKLTGFPRFPACGQKVPLRDLLIIETGGGFQPGNAWAGMIDFRGQTESHVDMTFLLPLLHPII